MRFKIPQFMYTPRLSFKSSWIPDDPDPRDKLFSKNLENFRVSSSSSSSIVSLKNYCSPVDNQFNHGICVANSCVNALELKRIQAGLTHVDLSRFFTYYNARLAHNAINIDDGTQVRYAMASLNSIGVCRAELWPFISKNINRRPAWKAYRESYKTKISGYYRISGDYKSINEQIEHAIRAGSPVVFGSKVYSDFRDGRLQDGYVARVPSKGENYIGRHAMLIVGFDSEKKMFLVKNSWGMLWGDLGYCWLPYKFLENAEASDFWVMTSYYDR